MVEADFMGKSTCSTAPFGVLLFRRRWISPVCCILKDCLAQECSFKSDLASEELLREKHLSWLCANKLISGFMLHSKLKSCLLSVLAQ